MQRREEAVAGVQAQGVAAGEPTGVVVGGLDDRQGDKCVCGRHTLLLLAVLDCWPLPLCAVHVVC